MCFLPDGIKESKMNEIAQAFWSVAASELLNQLHTTPQGLTEDDANEDFLHEGKILKRKN
ncbi:MAG: hypothetical protein A2Y65_12285 [Deltaproteobacteria bacterium RBG_13_52_11]|nr:MAG: hypothetical protein A2Y65_12285 [Deltaproteobacteria bacterium RBG_13_52_11]